MLPPCFDAAGDPEDPVPNPRRSVATFTAYIDTLAVIDINRLDLRKLLAKSATDFQVEPTRWDLATLWKQLVGRVWHRDPTG